MALSVVIILRMTATRMTLGFLPAAPDRQKPRHRVDNGGGQHSERFAPARNIRSGYARHGRCSGSAVTHLVSLQAPSGSPGSTEELSLGANRSDVKRSGASSVSRYKSI